MPRLARPLGAWSGARVAVSGTQSTGALTANATYSLNCTGGGGNATQSVTVSVTSPTPTLAFTAQPRYRRERR